MQTEFRSFSSRLMFSNTQMANHGGPFSAKKMLAELGYVAITVTALAETALAMLSTVFHRCVASDSMVQKQLDWLQSSAFCLCWAAADAVLNILCHPLICNESAARESAKLGGGVYPESSVF
jgi:hypothetical protein